MDHHRRPQGHHEEAGTNGGGFVNANTRHRPTRSSSPLADLVEMLRARRRPDVHVRQDGRARAIFIVACWAESGQPDRRQLGVAGGTVKARIISEQQVASLATVTTDTSCGAVNSMHDSFMPRSAASFRSSNMQLGEIVFGHVGGAGMIVFVVLTVFMAGLMVGRTPRTPGTDRTAPRCSCRSSPRS